MILCNHPSTGGSHTPDLTVITPVSTMGSGGEEGEGRGGGGGGERRRRGGGGGEEGRIPVLSCCLAFRAIRIFM